MEKGVKFGVLQERTNTLPLSSVTQVLPSSFSSQNLRHFHDTGMFSLKPSTISVAPEPALYKVQEHTPSIPPFIDPPDVFRPSSSTGHFKAPRINPEAARAARYAKAEQDLTETLQRSVDDQLSSRNLQIGALQHAKSMLNAQITDAKEQVQRLRSLLGDHEVEPEAYRSMQQQRWMEERRQTAAEELSTTLGKHLATLTSQPTPSPKLTMPSNAKPKAAPDLDRFFDMSRHRVQVRNRSRRHAVPAMHAVQEKKCDVPRIHHHRRTLSLKLKVPGPRHFFMAEMRSKTTEETAAKSDPIPPPSPRSPPLPVPSALPLPVISEAPEVTVPVSPSGSGIATIWYATPRTNEEILSDLVVSIPDYFTDLLAGLESTVSSQQVIATTLNPNPARPLALPAPNPRIHHSVDDGPPALHKSRSRRRLSNMLALPDSRLSRNSSSSPEALPQINKRFSAPPSTSVVLPRMRGRPQSHESVISEEDESMDTVSNSLAGVPATTGQRLTQGGRISLSASHLPDLIKPTHERDGEQGEDRRGRRESGIGSSSSHGAIGSGNMKLVRRLRHRISILRDKVVGGGNA